MPRSGELSPPAKLARSAACLRTSSQVARSTPGALFGALSNWGSLAPLPLVGGTAMFRGSKNRVATDAWKKDVWEFQAKSGSSGSCRLFHHFLGKIAVPKMSGKRLEVPDILLPDIRGLLRKGLAGRGWRLTGLKTQPKKFPELGPPSCKRGIGKWVQKRGLNLWHRKDFLTPTPSVRQPLFETSVLFTIKSQNYSGL